jgi:hypothetical protein
MTNYVWYLSYGSNLSKERFLCYIQGGTPTGSKKAEKGCRDHSLPLKDEAYEIPYPLYFSKNSSRWNGGVAFIGKVPEKNARTLARMYLITKEQFMDVVSQENAGKQLNIDFEEVKQEKSKEIVDAWYGNILYIGEKDGYPIYTFTSNEDIENAVLTKPSISYLNTIMIGLKEAFGLTHQEAMEYLKKTQRR